jgi:hypothetical protein
LATSRPKTLGISAALATIDAVRNALPEASDPVNGPEASFLRSIILVRAGHTEEEYAEVKRLLRVPFGAPLGIFEIATPPRSVLLAVKDDPRFDEIVNHPPRL